VEAVTDAEITYYPPEVLETDLLRVADRTSELGKLYARWTRDVRRSTAEYERRQRAQEEYERQGQVLTSR
jgi:hypothetical protein